VRQATISVDGTPRGTLQAVATKFGDRNAIVISLNPASVDFAELEQHRKLVVSLGTQQFEIAPWAQDQMAANMAACEARFLAR
jgi:hypothetical protein